MHTAESLLIELRANSFMIAERYIATFTQLYKKDPEKALDIYTEVIAKQYVREQAAAATDILHKSITEGVDDQLKLVVGVQEVNRDTGLEVKERISQVLSK